MSISTNRNHSLNESHMHNPYNYNVGCTNDKHIWYVIFNNPPPQFSYDAKSSCNWVQLTICYTWTGRHIHDTFKII